MKMGEFWKSAACALGFAGLLYASGTSSPAAADDDAYKIPLKLFGEFEIAEGLASCHYALWQHNRDPGADKYAYLFYMPFDSDGAPHPARVEVGKNVLALDELLRDGEWIAGMAKNSLYATRDRETRVHIEVLEAEDVGNHTRIDRATVYVVQSGKIPFQARARGTFGCAGLNAEDEESAAAPAPSPVPAGGWAGPAGIPLGAPRMLADMSEVPAALRQTMRDYASDDCDVDGSFAWAGARYVVNENYLLWEIPCTMGAYQGSSVFGVTQNPARDWTELLTLPNPPGLEGQQNYAAMSADVLPGQGIIKMTALSRGAGDCGVHQVHRLTDGPGEVLEFELLEYRDKYDCDGNATAPENWPLAYQSY